MFNYRLSKIIAAHLESFKEDLIASGAKTFPEAYRLSDEMKNQGIDPGALAHAEWLRSIDKMIYAFENPMLDDHMVGHGRELFFLRFNDLH